MARKRQASIIDMLGGVKKSLCSQVEHDEDLEMENYDIVTVLETQSSSSIMAKGTENEDDNLLELNDEQEEMMDEDQQIENEKDNEDFISQKETNKEQPDLSTCELNCDSPGSVLQSINLVNNNCADVCCSSDTKPFQPFNKEVLKEMTNSVRKFNSTWFKLYVFMANIM